MSSLSPVSQLGGSSSKTDRQNQLESWGDLKNIMYNTSQLGRDQSAEGAKGLSSSADYFKALMSGDQAQMSKVLAPQISVIQGQNQQRLNTTAQFGNRSGGNNASMQQGTEAAQRSVQQLFDMLGPEAAKEFANISGLQEQEGTSQEGLSANAAGTLGAQAGHAKETADQNSMATGQSVGQMAAMMAMFA